MKSTAEEKLELRRILSMVLVASCACSVFAANLVVDSNNSPLTLSSAAVTTNRYDGAVINGVLNLNDKVTLYLDGGSFDVGTASGVDAVVNLNGDPAVTSIRHGGTGSARYAFNIGAASNGGSGKFVVSGTNHTVPLPASYLNNIWNGYGQMTMRYQNLSVLAGAAANGKLTNESAANDVVDALELNPGGMAGISSMYNKNALPARVLFKGGAIAYNNCWEGDGFMADAGTKWILESVDGNPIHIYAHWGPRDLNKNGRTLETRGSGSVRLEGPGSTAGQNVFNVYSGIQWNHGGDLVLVNYARFRAQAANVLPHGTGRGGVRVSTDASASASDYTLNSWFDVYGKAQLLNSFEITGKGGWLVNSSGTTAALTFGTNDLNGTFRAPRMQGNFTITKMGSGTLTVTNTPAVSPLTVNGGMVNICRAAAGTVTIPSITMGSSGKVTVKAATTVDKIAVPNAGAELIVDGAQLTIRQKLPKLLTLTLVNGGTVKYAFAPASGVTDCLLPAATEALSGDVVKTGAGTLQVDAAGYLKSLAVEAGTVKLGAFGTDNRFWRVTYKQAMTAGQALYMGPLRLFTKDNAFADGGAPASAATQSHYTDKTGTISTPSALAANQFFCSTTRYTAPGGSGGHVIVKPEGMFYCSTVFSCCFTDVPKIDDSSTWITMTWRIPEAGSVGYPAGYDLKSQWEGQGNRRPGAWKLESSPTGLDGSWVTMDEKSGIKGSWGQSWYNGQNSGSVESANPWLTPAAIRASASSMASVGALKVASGATFDCSLVTGGQEIDDLTVDYAGGGTLVNVKFAANGVLRIENAPDGELPVGFRIPLAFTDVVATRKLGRWTVYVNGRPSKRGVTWVDGGIEVCPAGMILIVK